MRFQCVENTNVIYFIAIIHITFERACLIMLRYHQAVSTIFPTKFFSFLNFVLNFQGPVDRSICRICGEKGLLWPRLSHKSVCGEETCCTKECILCMLRLK